MLDKIFSIKNSPDGSRKIICFLGIKVKFKSPKMLLEGYIAQNVTREVYSALEVQNLHNKVFPKFKHINHGKSLAIFGSGPTLRYYSNNLKNTINIAMNDTIYLDNVSFDYLFVLDPIQFTSTNDYWDILKEYNCIKFVGKFLSSNNEQIPEIVDAEKYNIYRFFSGNRNHFSCKEYQKNIQHDIAMYPLADYHSVAFSALNFALYTYPKKIYLIGLDTSNNGHYFVNSCNYLTKQMIEGYKKFKRMAEIHYPETEIISINPVGLKGIFKDIYTKEYLDNHKELLKENIEIINEENINA